MQSTKKSIIKKAVAVVLTASLVATAFVFNGFGTSVSDYRSQINSLEDKQTELSNKIAALQTDIAKQEELKAALEQQVSTLQAQIDIYNTALDGLNAKIAENEEKCNQLESSLAERKDTFLARLKAMYVGGNSSSLSLLLGAKDYGDFLYKYELINKVTQSDNQAMDELKKGITELNEVTAKVTEQKQEQESLKGELEAKQNVLNASINEYNSIIYTMQMEKSELSAEYAQYESAIDSLEVELQAAIAQAQAEAAAAAAERNSGSYYYDNAADYTSSHVNVQNSAGGGFVNPLGNYGYIISSEFGYRDDVGEGHTNHGGMDFAGSNIYGQPIYAAADGEVIISGYNSYGYGYYIMINHGNWSDDNNYCTLYGHCSALAVSTGQYVTAGQIIGYVGSSGYSTGPHLHFEVRVNGTQVNPRSYMSL